MALSSNVEHTKVTTAAPQTVDFGQLRHEILSATEDQELKYTLERMLIIQETENALKEFQKQSFDEQALAAIPDLIHALEGKSDVEMEAMLKDFLGTHVTATEAPKKAPNAWQQIWFDLQHGKKPPVSVVGGFMALVKGTVDHFRGRRLDIRPEEQQALVDEAKRQALAWLQSQELDTSALHFTTDLAHLSHDEQSVMESMVQELQYGASMESIIHKRLEKKIHSHVLEQILFVPHTKEFRTLELSISDFL